MNKGETKEALNKFISFMVRQAHHERNQQLAVHPEPVEGLNQHFPKRQSSPSASQPVIDAQPNRKPVILTIDDDDMIRLMLKDILSYEGFEVWSAADGDAGLEIFQELHPVLVLLDVMMPGMDGYECTRRIREEETRLDWNHTPIIALTGNTLEGDKERCLAAGMDDYLSKPFRIDALQAILKQHTETASINRQPLPSESLPVADSCCVSPGPLSMLHNVGGAALVQKVLQLFFDTAQLQLANIKSGLLAGDMESVQLSAHSLKSAAAHVGAMQLSELARALEHAVRDKLPVTNAIGVTALERSYDDAVKILQQKLEPTCL